VKQCRRCNEEALDIIRESIVRRGARSFLICWYRCTSCQDVSFGYRLFPESSEAGRSAESPALELEGSTSDDPPRSDAPLSV
jgi:hypothetical protein